MTVHTRLAALLLPVTTLVQGFTLTAWGLKEFQIPDSELGTIRFYVTAQGIDILG